MYLTDNRTKFDLSQVTSDELDIQLYNYFVEIDINCLITITVKYEDTKGG